MPHDRVHRTPDRVLRAPDHVVTLTGDCPHCPLALLCLGGTLHVDRCLTCHGLYHVAFPERHVALRESIWYVLRCTLVRRTYGELIYGAGRCCGLTERCRQLEAEARRCE